MPSDPKRAASSVPDSASSNPNRAADAPLSKFARGKSRKRGGGGKLSRSETVTVRLDPKLRYLAELAARKQRRTLSSFIEWAIEENLKSIYLEEGNGALSIASQSADLWDVDEPDRFAKLAMRYPQMLTHDEQVLWKLVKENRYFWFHVRGGAVDESRLKFSNLRAHWSTLKKVAQGDLPKSTIPDEYDDFAVETVDG